jgi:RNA polymerase sigma-70 factor (ECF subfamily)
MFMPAKPCDPVPPEPIYNEKDLLLRVAGSDADAFRLLFLRYYGRIYSVAIRYLRVHALAEDVVQQSFLKVWEKRQLLKSVERFDAYLFRIARNDLISLFRKQSSHKRYLQRIGELFDEERNSPEEQLIIKQKRILIQDIISSLPPQQQQAYRMSRDQGLPYEEIAAGMGLSVSTVKGHISAALKTIRALAGARKNELYFLLIAWFLS